MTPPEMKIVGVNHQESEKKEEALNSLQELLNNLEQTKDYCAVFFSQEETTAPQADESLQDSPPVS